VISVGDHEYGAQPGILAPNVFAYSGDWDVGADGATSGDGAQIDAQFDARDVFLVMGADGGPRSVQVLLDGRPIPAKLAGDDVKRGRARINEERLYRLVELPASGSHRLSLIFDEGVEGYAFTFG
jgi:hypothetical protein